MAFIRVEIEADNIGELHTTLKGLLGEQKTSVRFEEDAEVGNPYTPQPEAGATQDAEPGERQRRTRRTRAQIEADNSAATSDSPSPSNPSTLKSDLLKTSESSTGEDSSEDPFAPAPEKTAASPNTSSGSPGKELTIEDVKSAMKDYLGKDGHNAADMNAILRSFKDENGEGVMRVSQIQPADRAAAIEALRAA